MTARQAQLIAGEIARHQALASAAGEPALMRSHLEVAEALRAALAGAMERSPTWEAKRKEQPPVRLSPRRDPSPRRIPGSSLVLVRRIRLRRRPS